MGATELVNDSMTGAVDVTVTTLKQENSDEAPYVIQATSGYKSWWKTESGDHVFVPIEPYSAVETNSKSDAESNPAGNKEISDGSDSHNDSANLYIPIDGYEGKHRFDPTATWTDQEERALIRNLDWRICLWACIMFFSLQLDRGNISQALSDTFLHDLKLTTNDFNNGQTIFTTSFLFAELPSQLISKKIGPDNWIPIQMILWSIVASCQYALSGRTTFYITRSLLGILEGGFIPDIVLYLSYFYKSRELPIRLGFFWISLTVTNITSSFLAYGLLHLKGHNGLAGWRWLFAIEGALTGCLGIISWLYLPASPTQTKRSGIKGLLRPKEGWFSEREEIIMVNRIVRDDPGKATMHNRQVITFKLLWESITDYHMWPIYFIGIVWQIPMIPPTSYLTLSLRSLGFTTFQTNLLSVPSSVLLVIQMFFWTWLSERWNQRFAIGVIAQIWVLPLLIALEVLTPQVQHFNWVKFGISSLIVGYPFVHAVLVALTSRNSGTVRTRTVGSSLYNISVQISSIIGSQIYRKDDAPLYRRGNKALLGVVAFNLFAFAGAKFYYVYVNNKRDAIWNSMTRNERVQYVATTKDEGNKRLDFRFAH